MTLRNLLRRFFNTIKHQKIFTLKIPRLIFSLLIYLVFLEAFLWLPSFFNEISTFSTQPKESRKVSILVLGESTSADSTAAFDSWPIILKKKLEALGYEIALYNLARPATTTAILRMEAEKFLRQKQIDIAVTMMGINDFGGFFFTKKNPSWFENLKTYKFLRLALMSEDEKNRWFDVNLNDFYKIPKITRAESVQLSNIFIKLMKISKNESSTFIKSEIIDKYAPNRVPTLLVSAASMLHKWDKQKSVQFFLEAIKLLPKNALLYNSKMVPHAFNAAYENCEKIAKLAVLNEISLKTFAKWQLSYCLRKGKSTFTSIFEEKYKIQSWYTGITSTKETLVNYRVITSLFKKHRAVHIAMQYPLLPIDDLQIFFSDYKYKPDFFVENVEQFNYALKKYGPKAIFTDNFAGIFGHATLLGNQMLANQVLPVVLKSIDQR